MIVDIPLRQICQLTGADSAHFRETIQSLWSGYGVIAKVDLQIPEYSQPQPVIVKFVSPPDQRSHKYGWQGDASHRRKLSSYQNEFNWYQNVAAACDSNCRIPRLFAGQQQPPKWLFILEDLDRAGFPLRHTRVTDRRLESCLRWLAHFHATFLDDRQAGECFSRTPDAGQLWPIGTYWHLGTRPDEFAAMPDSDLKTAAAAIDQTLNQTRFQTLVHGDAKLANFCFSVDDQAAAVDFQYVGGGCGIKDLAYFVSSCFAEDECERREPEILDRYFGFLKLAMSERDIQLPWHRLESEWRSMYKIAWADFYRFLAGWSPGHWKIHSYSQRMANDVIRSLGID